MRRLTAALPFTRPLAPRPEEPFISCCLFERLAISTAFDAPAPLSPAPYCPQRTLEELFIKGPVANPRDNPEYAQVGAWVGAGLAGPGRAWPGRASCILL